MHRKDFVDILKQSIPSSCTVHFNKRLTKYEKQSPGSLTLYFADDSTSSADVLVGADGIHSSVRKTFFEAIGPDTIDPSKIRHYSDPSWTGTLVYRSVFPAEKLSELDPSNVALKDFIIVSPQKAVMIVRDNFHFAVLREGKSGFITINWPLLADKYLKAHRLLSGFARNANKYRSICF
jgi:2-polyprenyl-6-methoxyphenol hydroxylase-like FAD-dependent oxidoreductase